MKRRLFAGLAALAVVVSASPARADVETWDWVEMRLPLSEGQRGLPHSLRVMTDLRFATRYPGALGQMFVRVGPIWELHPNVVLGLQTTVYASQVDPAGRPGVFETVFRPELEPNIRWRWGDFSFNDRHRLEYAYAASRPAASTWRYRNQLRVNHQPAGVTQRWYPYVWDEVFVPFNTGFSENHASVGLAFPLSEHARLDTGYVLRTRASGGGWVNDHVLNVFLFFAPGVPALVRDEIPGGVGE